MRGEYDHGDLLLFKYSIFIFLKGHLTTTTTTIMILVFPDSLLVCQCQWRNQINFLYVSFIIYTKQI